MKRVFRNFQRGFSFIELSIATAIFSMGLGSLSLMMLAATMGTAEARHRTIAASQAESMAEMIAMTSDAYGHYMFPVEGIDAVCDGGTCTGKNMAEANLAHWLRILRDELPGGDGLVCRDSTPKDGEPGDPSCDGEGPLVIKIFWTESRHENTSDGGLRRVVSRLPW